MKCALIGFLAVLPLAQVTADITSDLVAYYSFDGESENSVGSSLDLTQTAIVFGQGVKSHAADFTQANSTMKSLDPSPISGNASRTIAAWVNMESFQDKRRIFTIGKDESPSTVGTSFGIVVYSTGAIVVNCDGIDVYSEPGVIKLNQWHHIAVTYPGAVDGFPVRLATVDNANGNTLNTSVTGFSVGKSTDLPSVDWNRSWDGRIDELRVYNRARRFSFSDWKPCPKPEASGASPIVAKRKRHFEKFSIFRHGEMTEESVWIFSLPVAEF